MSALRFAVPALAAALAGCTFNPDGSVTRSDAPPPELLPYKLAPRPDGPAPTLIPRKSTDPEVTENKGPVLASTTAGAAAGTAATTASPATVASMKTSATAAAAPPPPPRPSVASCCASLPQAVGLSAAQAGDTVVLSATTPHFDFGRGTAPFAVYALPAGTRSVQIYSPMERVGLLEGGDNSTRFADTWPLFLDASAKPLEAKQLDAGQRWWGASARAYFRSYEVPAGATRLVVATDPQGEGRLGMSMIYGDPKMPLVASDYQEFRMNGLTVAGYNMTTYGPVVVQVNR